MLYHINAHATKAQALSDKGRGLFPYHEVTSRLWRTTIYLHLLVYAYANSVLTYLDGPKTLSANCISKQAHFQDIYEHY